MMFGKLVLTVYCASRTSFGIEPTSDDQNTIEKCEDNIPLIETTHNESGSPSECYDSSKRDQGYQYSVTLYYVRHGESEWNLESEGASERKLNTRPELTDAKLTAKGAAEARKLSETITQLAHKGGDWELLAGEKNLHQRRVAYATSNLRRASLTFLTAFKHLITPHLKIDELHILSALQEPAPNIDSNSLSSPQGPPALSDSCPLLTVPMDSECNHGDEMKRSDHPHTPEMLLGNFCRWLRNMAVFGHVPSAGEAVPVKGTGITDFVVAGHSMFLRGFFQRFLARRVSNFWKMNKVEKKLKSTINTVGNGSLIKITLELNPPFINGKKQPDTEICKIIPGNTIILDGEIHGRNVFKKVLRTIKVNALENHLAKDN